MAWLLLSDAVAKMLHLRIPDTFKPAHVPFFLHFGITYLH